MKSSNSQLANRGFLSPGNETALLDKPFAQCLTLLQSKKAIDRTLGARLIGIGKNAKAVDYLTKALQTEKCLYPKIEICNALVLFGTLAVTPLIGLMGKIGNNQHVAVCEKEFKKDSYPLPRDIASRTIIRIGTKAIPELLNAMGDSDIKKLSAAIDTIGFINFYEKQPSEVYNSLLTCYYANIDNELIKWKIIRAFSGFSGSISFLTDLLLNENNQSLLQEIKRSLIIIGRKL